MKKQVSVPASTGGSHGDDINNPFKTRVYILKDGVHSFKLLKTGHESKVWDFYKPTGYTADNFWARVDRGNFLAGK